MQIAPAAFSMSIIFAGDYVEYIIFDFEIWNSWPVIWILTGEIWHSKREMLHPKGHGNRRYVFLKASKLWWLEKCHGEKPPDWKKVTQYAPDSFCQRPSVQSKNVGLTGVLRGQFAPANGRTEQSGRGITCLTHNSNTRPSRAGRQGWCNLSEGFL